MSKSTQIKWRILDMQIELKDPTIEKRLQEHYEKLVVIYGELEEIYSKEEELKDEYQRKQSARSL